MKIYAIYDNRAKSWGTPFFQPTDVHATRMFKMEVNRADPGNPIYLYPTEFELHRVGTYDQDTGLVEGASDTEPNKIANGESLKAEVTK